MQTFEFRREITGDGSPTLRLPPTWEPMHALEGAFTETLYIYQPTIAQALEIVKCPRILSIGLGLGYNEILTVCEALKADRLHLFLDSYESVEQLQTQFTSWIYDSPSLLTDIYDDIAQRFANHYQIDPQQIKKILQHWLNEKQLVLHSAITATSRFQTSHGILFDAFSSKSSPELWTEDFLDSFLTFTKETPCFLSTYACKGNLTRALRKHGFSVEKRAGFGKKRESTFAHKHARTC
ncbi:MAG: hypothetical protein H6623_00330 [Bdellovibrionaceae bacterium]|nr:hypothetical protein [Pseudobdellovibrionaceae bacterium]